MYQLKKNNPDKKFYIMSEELICPNMKKTTLESIVSCLEKSEHEISVPQDVAEKAKKALNRMLELGK
jgi:quinolinate synthase